MMLSWCRQQAPALLSDQVHTHLSRLRTQGASAGFLELPSEGELLLAIQRGQRRWLKFLRSAGELEQKDELLRDHAGGSATTPSSFTGIGRSEAYMASAPPGPCFVVYTDGCSLGAKAPGGWAFHIRDDHGRAHIDSGGLPRATNNQAELMAAIFALRQIASGAQVRVYTDSQYVADGINHRIREWDDLGRLFPMGGHAAPLTNRDLLQQLSRELDRLTCEAVHIAGHAGHELNELCDVLAAQAAHGMLHNSKRILIDEDDFLD
jgi:ribonuclease HI